MCCLVPVCLCILSSMYGSATSSPFQAPLPSSPVSTFWSLLGSLPPCRCGARTSSVLLAWQQVIHHWDTQPLSRLRLSMARLPEAFQRRHTSRALLSWGAILAIVWVAGFINDGASRMLNAIGKDDGLYVSRSLRRPGDDLLPQMACPPRSRCAAHAWNETTRGFLNGSWVYRYY